MKNNKYLDNIIITITLLFLFLPILIIALFSFNTSSLNIIFEGFTFKWYLEIFKNTALLEAIGNTLLIAVLSTLISTILGTISAYALKTFDFKTKDLINKLLYIPIVIPEIVLGISLLCTYTLCKMQLGMTTLLLSHICFSTPFVIINVKGVLESINPYIEQAAFDLGASRFTTFRKIIAPLLVPGIISGAELAFTLSLDDVVISYFTAGPGSNTLPLYIYSIVKTGITPDINAVITIMITIICLILTFNALRTIRSMKDE